MRLDRLPHLGDGALGGDAEDLREREGGRRLGDRRGADGEGDRGEQLEPPLADHLVDDELRARRQDEAEQAANVGDLMRVARKLYDWKREMMRVGR